MRNAAFCTLKDMPYDPKVAYLRIGNATFCCTFVPHPTYQTDTQHITVAHKYTAYLRQNDFYFASTAKIRGYKKTERKHNGVFGDTVL